MKKDTPNWDRKQHDKNQNNKLKRDKRRTMLALREREFRQEEKQERKKMYYAQVRKQRDIKDDARRRMKASNSAVGEVKINTNTESEVKIDIEPNEEEWSAQKISAGDKTALEG